MNDLIYLDNNSTTPIDPRVLEEMLPYFSNLFGNASSTHAFGIHINQKVKIARQQVADLINCDTNELIFTSGATESINLGMKGYALANQHKGNHIITCLTEHKAVLDTCHYLEQIGFEVTYLSVQNDGLIDIEELKNALKKETILVSIMWVNNETGVIQPINKIIDATHQNGSLFFTDATQIVGKSIVDVYNLGIDMLAFSAHKFYGPKGIGGLFVRQGVKIIPQTHGGGHEHGMRSGTSNVAGIVGLGKACAIALNEMCENEEKIRLLRDYLESEILLKIEGAFVNGSIQNRLYNVTNIAFPNTDANILIGQLKHIAISNGSACTAAIFEPSHVLMAMGLSKDNAFGSFRFSLGKLNSKREIEESIQLLSCYIENRLNF